MGELNLYVPNPEQWRREYERDYFDSRTLKCDIYENVLVEPPICVRSTGSGVAYSGGICYTDGTFIAGLYRSPSDPKMDLSLGESYPVDEKETTYLEGEYIYGGMIYNIFGHAITDSLVRLWYVVKHTELKHKILFVLNTKSQDPQGVIPVFWQLIDLLNIDRDRVIIVDKVYRCQYIHVPDQSFSNFGYYTTEMLTVYDKICESISGKFPVEKKYEKVYYTRTEIQTKRDCFNEAFFMNFYKKRGYTIIAPETLSFEEQINILNQAKEIIAPVGTLSHNVIFSKYHTKLTILLRENGVNDAYVQRLINQARNISCSIVDVSMSILPTTVAGGVFLLGPTKYWKSYLDDNHFEYNDDDLMMDWSNLYDYLNEYTKVYSVNTFRYQRVKNSDLFDVINRMSTVFKGIPLNRTKMDTPSKPQLENTIKESKQKIESLTGENQKILTELEALNDQKDELQNQLNILSDEKINILTERDELLSQNKCLISENNEHKETIRIISDEKTAAQQEVQTLMSRTLELENANANVRYENSSLKNELLGMQNENADLSEQLENAHQENYELTTRYYVPRCLDVVSADRKKVVVHTVVSGSELNINGSAIVNCRPDAIKKKYCEFNNRWDSLKGIFYAHLFLKKYDLLFYSVDGSVTIGNEDAKKLANSSIDMVVNSPVKLTTSVETYYSDNYGVETWEIMLEALKKSSPDYYSSAADVFNDNYLYASNSFVSKEKCFNEFAEWLLPVINDIGANITSKEIPLLSKITDILFTLFITYNQDRYIIGIWE